MESTDQNYDSEYDIVVPVPLPTEIPQPPNLSSLPARILHSGTVETLIGQNEDLMARLKVNIRRNSLLEQDLMDLERANEDLAKTNRSIVAQLEVLEEKDRFSKEKSVAFQAERRELQEEIDRLQKDIELLKLKLESSEERKDELQAGLRFEERYRRRIRAWIRPMVDRLKQQSFETNSKYEFLGRQLAGREAMVGDLQQRLTEANERIKGLHAQSGADQLKIVEQYETKTTLLEKELVRIRTEYKISIEKAARFEQATASNAELENKIVELERKQANSHSLIAQLEAQTDKYRKEAKMLAAELIETRDMIESSVAEKQALLEDTSKVRDQFESLQAVWSETQKQLETSRMQNEALGKLNQELSRQLSNQRKNGTSNGAIEMAPLKTPVDKPATDRLNRIDSLLAELESGFSTTKEFQLENLDIVEDNIV
jgi:chromosome segregation ATPase